MTALVIDASVAPKCVLPEPHSPGALGILESTDALLAPDLIYAEAGNTFWKRVARGEMDESEAHAAVAVFRRLPLRIYAHTRLMGVALELALRTGCTVYDALYLALAVARDTPMVTADRRLFERISASPLADRIRWVADCIG